MKKLLCFVLAICIIAVSLPAAALAAEGDTVITIYHTNDVHGYISEYLGYARLKSIVDNDGSDMTLLVDAGDFMNGMPTVTETRGEAAARLIKAAGYDAVTLGNHDFDFGSDTLLEYADEYELPIISANVTREADGEALFDSCKTWECGGVTVGMFGLTTPETSYKTAPAMTEGLSFGTEAQLFETAGSCVEQLREAGADVIIALTHLGSGSYYFPSSEELAEAVDGIDVIIDGHSHSTLAGEAVGDTVITSCGEYMKNLGAVSITVSGGCISIDTYVNPYTDYADVEPDAGVTAVAEDISGGLADILGEIVLESAPSLNGERNDVRSGSTDLGRIIAAAMARSADADIGMLNSGSIRASIAAGEVTRGDLVSVLPFGNYIIKVSVTGQDIIDTLNASMVCGTGGFPQFYGMEVDAAKLTHRMPDGALYYSLDVDSVRVGGKPIDPAATYTVAINDYMYSGGDSYILFAGKLTGEYETVMSAFIDYMKGDYMPAANADILSVAPLWERFTDISGHWSFQSVCGVVDGGLMDGVSRSMFAPDSYVNRAMAVAVLHRLAGSPDSANVVFTDVAEGDWYCDSVGWAADAGITVGTGGGCFSPAENVTREDLALLLYRFAKLSGEDVSSASTLDGYSDASDVSDYAAEALGWAVDAGIIDGMGGGLLSPAGCATRAQLAAVLQRYMEYAG